MIHVKNPRELAIMKEGGALLRSILDKLLAEVHAGATPNEIEAIAVELIKKTGGEPSFKRVPGYHWATCINVNDVVVHGIPGDDPFAEGDVIGVDVGLFYKGFHTDTSWSVLVADKQSDTDYQKRRKFLSIGEKALEKGLEQVKIGNKIGHISRAMHRVIDGNDYSVVSELVGHGIGRELHEDPEIPGKLASPLAQTAKIQPGHAYAIEIIYTMGKPDIVVDDDSWTIRTKDGTISGLFEKTVIVTDHGVFVVT